MFLVTKALLSTMFLTALSTDYPRKITRRAFLETAAAAAGAPNLSVTRILTDPGEAIRTFPLGRGVYPAGWADDLIRKYAIKPEAPEWILAEASRRSMKPSNFALEIVDTEMRVAREFDLNPHDVHEEVQRLFGIERRPIVGAEIPAEEREVLGPQFRDFMSEVIRYTSENAPKTTEWTQGIWRGTPISATRDWTSLPDFMRNRVGPAETEIMDSGWSRWREPIAIHNAPALRTDQGSNSSGDQNASRSGVDERTSSEEIRSTREYNQSQALCSTFL